MNKLIISLLIIQFIVIEKAISQRIYGFSDNIFCSINILDNSKDTLIEFSGNPWINTGFRSAIDRYNGRYFFGGSLPGHYGNFHIIDLVNLSIESHYIYPENIEYDFAKNRLVYEKNGMFYALDLETLQVINLGLIDMGNSIIYGQIRTYVPQGNKYFFVDYINGSLGDPYFLLIDADSGEISCQEIIEENNGIFYSPGGLVTNNLSGEIIGHRNGRLGIISPCNGTMTKLLEIPDYHSHLNNQMAVYNHNDNTYIIPYYSMSPTDKYKMAIVDVYNNEIIETRSQPWKGRMNLHQIYDKPIAPIVYLRDTLYVPKGEHYKWFLNDQFIGETDQNYWVPLVNGTYKAEIEYREYTTISIEKDIYISSIEESENCSSFKIFPNPSSHFINLNFSQSVNGVVKIIDLTGQIVYKRMVKDANNIQIDLNGLAKGNYIINIQTEQNQISKTFSKL